MVDSFSARNFNKTEIKMGIKRDSSSLSEELTEDEAALYDRQIRLWGLQSQKRLREAKILLIGLGGLGAEIAKNIVLAGVKSITLMDDQMVQPNDRISQFLIVDCEPEKNRAEASQPAIRQLNPNVEVLTETEEICKKDDDYFMEFNVICATNCVLPDLLRLNKICREHAIKFYAGNTWGFYGYSFSDLLEHRFTMEKSVFEEPTNKANKEKKTLLVEKTQTYCSFEKSLSITGGKGLGKRTCNVFFLLHVLNAFSEQKKRLPSPTSRDADIEELKVLRDSIMSNLKVDATRVGDEMLSSVFGEISPICAVVGGILAQEIIKGISNEGEPIQNFFLFDGEKSAGVVENIGNSCY